MPIKVTEQSTIEQFLESVLPFAYRAGLHRVPAKFSSDMFLLLHSITAVQIADLLISYLSDQADGVAKELAKYKEEIWLTTFLHDILKEANLRGERLDHQDIRPDDVSAWLERLGIQLRVTSPMRLAARIAMHERGGLPLFSALVDNMEKDDLSQLIVRLSDQLASLTAINEHWMYERHGLPAMVDTLNGRGSLKGINQRVQALGATESLSLFSHYHTRLTYPYLTNQLLAGTVASLRELHIEPLLVMADGVVYIGTQAQCALAMQQATDDSINGLAHRILDKTWERIEAALVASPLRPEDIRSTKNGMKVFSQMRLLGTPITGDRDLFTTLGICISNGVMTKTFARASAKDKAIKVAKQVENVLKFVAKLPKLYEDTLQSSRGPHLSQNNRILKFKDIPSQSGYTPDALKAKVGGVTDQNVIGAEFRRFGDSIAELVSHANPQEFETNLRKQTRLSFEPAVRSLIDGGIVISETTLQLPDADKKLADKFCPTCGQQAFTTKEAKRATSKQRETFFPVKVRTHTNSGTGAGTDGTRETCQTCWLELGLQGMGLSAEAFNPERKQSMIRLHLLPFFAFPMSFMDAARRQFGFNRGELRAQFSESTLKILYQALFAADDVAASEWEWIRKIAAPLRFMGAAFFAEQDGARNRDEFFGTPPLDVAGSVTLSLYARRNEKKPGGKDWEDEIGRKEMWTRGTTLAAILADALPVRVVVSESPLVNFNPMEIKSSLTLVNPPEVITTTLSRLRQQRTSKYRFDPGENAVSHTELPDLLRLLTFALRVNKTMGGVINGKDGREYSQRTSRRVVEIVQALADGMLVGAWLHQRDVQSRQFDPKWFDADYHLFTQSCLEVDKMLNPKEVDRLRELARITQTFYSPPVYDSSHALTLPFKVATQTLQKFDAMGVTEAELKTIMRSDIESAIRRQANAEANRAWIVLKRKKTLRKPDDSPVATQLTEGVRAFADAFMRDIVEGICGDMTNFLILRKRLQSGYLLQMKDLALATWEREGRRMFKASSQSQINETGDDLSVPA